MQVSRLYEVDQRLSRGGVLGRLADLQSTRDMDFVDANAFAFQGGSRVGDIFKLDRLMTDVVTDTDVSLDRVEIVVARRAVSQAAEERHRFGGCFEHTARLWFD